MGWFDRNEFNCIRYYNGTYGNGDSSARRSYYGMSAEPTMMFDGKVQVVGAGTNVIDGMAYRGMIENLMVKPDYYKITINSFDLTPGTTGSINLDIECKENVPDISQMTLRMSIVEDDLYSSGHTHMDVNRDMLPDRAITIDTVGETQNVDLTFTVDAGWLNNLRVVCFIQNDADKEILGGTTTNPNPDYSMRYYALGARTEIGESNQMYPHQYGWFRVYNTGNLVDNYTVSVAIENAPANWYPLICDDSVCYGETYSEVLQPGDYMELMVELLVGDSGYGDITVDITQDNYPAGWERTIQYNYLTDDLDVLVVDDDGNAGYTPYYTEALATRDLSFGVWNRASGSVDASLLLNYPMVVWFIGEEYPTVDTEDKAALGTYLDNGGNLFISGMDIGWELNDSGSENDPVWYHTYLHANYVNDDTNHYGLEGVPGDPISDGIDITIQGGDGANNQTYPSDIDPYGPYSSTIWTYDATRNAAIKADTGTYKVVYLAFGFEAISNAADRATVMGAAIEWLTPVDPAAVEPGSPMFNAALNAYPNPVRGTSQVSFTLPAAEKASLQVFSCDGRLVKTLASGTLAEGNQTLSWDRTDTAGAPVSAGIYYYQLNGENTQLTRKVVLLK
jgi:FlgD Ig-like domain